MRHHLRALFTPHLAAAHVLEQRLAVKEPECRVFQCRDLDALSAAIGELAHQVRMFDFPLGPGGRILEDPASDQLFVGVADSSTPVWTRTVDSRMSRE